MRLSLIAILLSTACATGSAFATTTMPATLPAVLPPPAIVLDGAKPAVDSAAPDTTAASLDHALAGDWRSAGNVGRDSYRHPRETLAFFGVRDDQTVIEIWPGGGWYAQVLAPMLREHGHYIAIVTKPAGDEKSRASTQRSNDALRAQFAAHPEAFDQAEVRESDNASPDLGPPASVDAVLTFRNVHNWVMAGNEQAMFKAFFDVLRPGGTLGVVDHRAAEDQPPAEMKSSGYLPEAYVIALAEAAGFKLVAKSEINANPRDTKDYPGGVWTLPPTLSKGDTDRAKYQTIGESDRMTLKFTKPD